MELGSSGSLQGPMAARSALWWCAKGITVILYHLCVMGVVYQQLPMQVQISIFTVMREVCDKTIPFSDRYQ